MRRILPILPDGPADVDLAECYAFPAERWLRLNMVASVDGATWLKGVSGGLSGAGDRRIFHVLRGLADVILVGAATVRAEGYGPARPREGWAALRAGRPPTPPIAVVTRHIDLDLDGALFTEAEPHARPIVITTSAAPAARLARAAEVAEVVVAGEDRVEPRLAVQALHERGLGRILCEGGPALNGQLAAAGLVDEVCLTVSPLLLGGDARRILDGAAAPTELSLAQVLEEDGFLFCRYLRRAS